MSIKSEVIVEQIESITLPFYHKDMVGITEVQVKEISWSLNQLKSEIDIYLKYLEDIKSSGQA